MIYNNLNIVMDIQRTCILIFVWFLIFYEFFSFMILFAPLLVQVNAIFYPYIIIFVCFVTLLSISYYKSIVTEPGSPSSDINEHYDDLQNIKNIARQEQVIKKTIRQSKTQHANLEFDEIQSLNRVGFCFKCSKIKQVRVHHCKICKKCIIRMDHHCPWVGNCVGKYNHKYFILFLFYATISLSIVCLTIAFDYFLGQTVAIKLQQIQRILLYCCCVSSGLLASSIGFLFVTQMMTVSKNLTTLQNFVQGIVQRNPWNKEIFSQNMQQIFGKSSWLIPSKPIFNSDFIPYDSIQI